MRSCSPLACSASSLTILESCSTFHQRARIFKCNIFHSSMSLGLAAHTHASACPVTLLQIQCRIFFACHILCVATENESNQLNPHSTLNMLENSNGIAAMIHLTARIFFDYHFPWKDFDLMGLERGCDYPLLLAPLRNEQDEAIARQHPLLLAICNEYNEAVACYTGCSSNLLSLMETSLYQRLPRLQGSLLDHSPCTFLEVGFVTLDAMKAKLKAVELEIWHV